ncbi:MAG: glycoside hydrolase family 97 protein [Ilyomonas sp.]
MKKSSLLFILILISFFGFAKDTLRIISPDKRIQVNVWSNDMLYYEVLYDKKAAIAPSIIDMELLNGIKLSNDLSVRSSKQHSVNEIIISPVPDKRRNIPDVYNELHIQFRKNFEVFFRVYNDGVAYRISSKIKDSITVKNETAQFNFPFNDTVYYPQVHKREDADIFHTSFEELYRVTLLDSIDNNSIAFSPVLIYSSRHPKIVITESNLDDYPGMFLSGNNNTSLHGVFAPYPLEEQVVEGDYPQRIVTKRADYIARTNGTRNFPWRVIILAKEDKELPSNDLVYQLGSPSRLKDVSWIQPGKCTDEWIIDVNLFNVPFKSGVNTASYKYYIDFAKRFGFDRILMDAGWSDTKDLFKINPNINMDSITAYAKQQGIKISMWTLAMTLDRQLDSALEQFKKWGVDFIMTDFIDRDDQKTVNFYKRITEACAKVNIMIMFHGAYPAKGFNRTYPNNITREGVLGSEYNAWSDKPTPEHNLVIPFTRMLAGPLDYEPGILDNATQAQFRPIWGKVMSQGTRCHQLAMFVVYDTPLPIFSGNPSQGYMEPAFMEFLGSLPNTWDETKILDAKVSDYIITVKKKGDDWYIAGMTDWSSRDLVITLDFLEEGNYKATICRDGINAERYASDYILEEKQLQKNDRLTVHLAPGGGFLIRLSK